VQYVSASPDVFSFAMNRANRLAVCSYVIMQGCYYIYSSNFKMMKAILLIFPLLLVQMNNVYAQAAVIPVKIGQKAPELKFPNPAHKELKLSEINKGRYVLLDFWSSWCIPCRASSPRLVQVYNDYSKRKFKGAPKGFTVVSYSFDQDTERWGQAIDKDGLIWPYHFSDFKGWGSPVVKLYGVEHIPQAFLLDPKGKIVGRYGSIEEVEKDIVKYVE
jgi:thiol-disulfide isomerase/thioredoxin